MFVKNITVYCSYVENREIKYIRKQIKGVFIDKTKAVNVNLGVTNANSVFVAIPKENVLNYKTPKEFAKNPNAYVTFKEGDKLVEGLIDKNYNSMTDLEKEQDNVYTITAVDFKDFGSKPHFEITGK